MVTGTGLVASMLSSFREDDSVLIFASGVSNSKEHDLSAYQRERDLLSSFGKTKARLVYFSSCSVYDPASDASLYVRHKKEMERMIADHFSDYLIIRLPLLISHSSNPFTFFNFIRNRILLGEKLRVQKNAWRYLFDADDLKDLVPKLLSLSVPRQVVNMAYENAAPVPDLIVMFEEILGRKVEKEFVQEGSFYDFDRAEFLSLLEKNQIWIEKDAYNYAVLKKYLSLPANPKV